MFVAIIVVIWRLIMFTISDLYTVVLYLVLMTAFGSELIRSFVYKCHLVSCDYVKFLRFVLLLQTPVVARIDHLIEYSLVLSFEVQMCRPHCAVSEVSVPKWKLPLSDLLIERHHRRTDMCFSGNIYQKWMNFNQYFLFRWCCYGNVRPP